MSSLNRITTGLSLFLLLLLAGCGGGGGGGATSGGSTGTGLTGSVRGVVSPASVTSGTGVTISLDGTSQSTTAGPDGSFSLGNIPSGTYTLVIQSGAQAGDLVVVVSGNSVTNIGSVDLVGAGQVAGLVTDSSTSLPISGATVSVTDTAATTTNQSPHPTRAARTNADGSYTVDGLPAGSYIVTISKRGYTTGTVDVTVTAGATAEGDLALVASATAGTGTVQGTVTTTNSDGSTSPLSGVFVALYSSSSGSSSSSSIPLPPTAVNSNKQTVTFYTPGSNWRGAYAYTASDGTYTISGVPAGTYTATAVRPGFQSSSQSVTVTQSQTSTANFTLTLLQISTGTVTGTVTDATTSAAISGATVSAIVYGPIPGGSGISNQPLATTVLPNQPSQFVLSTTTDANGNYTLVVPTATYAVAASANGYESTEQTISVAQGATDTVNLTLTAISTTKVTLSGTVTLAAASGGGSPTPVSGATVNISTSPVAIPLTAAPIRIANYTATTDQNGNYSISIPTGLYDIFAQSNGEFSVPTYVQVNANTTQNLVLTSPVLGSPGPISTPGSGSGSSGG